MDPTGSRSRSNSIKPSSEQDLREVKQSTDKGKFEGRVFTWERLRSESHNGTTLALSDGLGPEPSPTHSPKNKMKRSSSVNDLFRSQEGPPSPKAPPRRLGTSSGTSSKALSSSEPQPRKIEKITPSSQTVIEGKKHEKLGMIASLFHKKPKGKDDLKNQVLEKMSREVKELKEDMLKFVKDTPLTEKDLVAIRSIKEWKSDKHSMFQFLYDSLNIDFTKTVLLKFGAKHYHDEEINFIIKVNEYKNAEGQKKIDLFKQIMHDFVDESTAKSNININSETREALLKQRKRLEDSSSHHQYTYKELKKRETEFDHIIGNKGISFDHITGPESNKYFDNAEKQCADLVYQGYELSFREQINTLREVLARLSETS